LLRDIVRNIAFMLPNSCQKINGFFGEQYFKHHIKKSLLP
jgi:hypothetical protein